MNNRRSFITPTIFQVLSQKQQSQGYSQLKQQFFQNLHHQQMRYIKLKHGKKTKQTQNQIMSIIQSLIQGYTDCIDYFQSLVQTSAAAYFQLKIKEINKYYLFLHSIISNTSNQTKNGSAVDSIKDLGSISDQTNTQLLPGQQSDKDNVVGKQALKRNLIVSIQNQNISSHINQNMKKAIIIQNKVDQSLKKQEDQFLKRKMKRINVSNKRRSFLSFSQRSPISSIGFSNVNQKDNSLNEQEISDLIVIDMQALEVDNQQKFKELTIKKKDKPVSTTQLDKLT